MGGNGIASSGTHECSSDIFLQIGASIGQCSYICTHLSCRARSRGRTKKKSGPGVGDQSRRSKKGRKRMMDRVLAAVCGGVGAGEALHMANQIGRAHV